MKKQTVKAAVIEFLGSFLITMVCCWSLYSIKEHQIGFLGHSLIGGMLLATLIWMAIVESGSHFNPIITIGILSKLIMSS
jgi:glycerol uptake facilitator-like aquaporin